MKPFFWGVEGALEPLLSKAVVLQYGASVLDVVTLVVLTTFDYLVSSKRLAVRKPGTPF